MHALLDDTDQLADLFGDIQFEVKDLSATYLANQRLQVVNQTGHDLKVRTAQVAVHTVLSIYSMGVIVELSRLLFIYCFK